MSSSSRTTCIPLGINPLRPAPQRTIVLFTREPGGPAVPRAAVNQPLGGGLITSLRINGYRFGLDDSGTVHSWLKLTGGRDAIVSFRSDGSSHIIARTGDALPQGRMLDGLRDIKASADGRVAFLTGNAVSDVDRSIALHQFGTNVLVVRNVCRVRFNAAPGCLLDQNPRPHTVASHRSRLVRGGVAGAECSQDFAGGESGTPGVVQERTALRARVLRNAEIRAGVAFARGSDGYTPGRTQ